MSQPDYNTFYSTKKIQSKTSSSHFFPVIGDIMSFFFSRLKFPITFQPSELFLPPIYEFILVHVLSHIIHSSSEFLFLHFCLCFILFYPHLFLYTGISNIWLSCPLLLVLYRYPNSRVSFLISLCFFCAVLIYFSIFLLYFEKVHLLLISCPVVSN